MTLAGLAIEAFSNVDNVAYSIKSSDQIRINAPQRLPPDGHSSKFLIRSAVLGFKPNTLSTFVLLKHGTRRDDNVCEFRAAPRGKLLIFQPPTWRISQPS